MITLRRNIFYVTSLVIMATRIRNWWVLPQLFIRPGKKIMVLLKSGLKFYVTNLLDLHIIKETIFDGVYNFNYKLSPKIILDVGAHVGDYSIYMGLEYPKAKIFAFEPNPKTYKILVENIKVNGVKNVTTINLGLSNRSQKEKLYLQLASGMTSVYKKENHSFSSVSINTLSLADFLRKYSVNSVDIMKVDCEGAEYKIFLGLPKNTLSQIKNITMEYHDGLAKNSHVDLVKLFRKSNYNLTTQASKYEKSIGILKAITRN